jgi:hypothetical protein
MREETKPFIKKATKRAIESNPDCWATLTNEQKFDIIRLFIGIMIVELEMSEYAADLDYEALNEVRQMTIDEWKDFDDSVLPMPSDNFIKEKIFERVNCGYEKYIDTNTGEMVVIVDEGKTIEE